MPAPIISEKRISVSGCFWDYEIFTFFPLNSAKWFGSYDHYRFPPKVMLGGYADRAHCSLNDEG